MKKILFSLAAVTALTFTSQAQAPEGFKYQAVVRDAGNLVLNNQAVGMQLTIHQGTPAGTAVYTEMFATTSNAFGIVNLEIGTGTTSDDFTTIDWSAGPYFIETAVDLTGGTSYTSMGTSQLMSVPYALYAKGADETDPAFNASVAAGITAGDITNWNTDLVDDADADPTNELQVIVSADAGNAIAAGSDGGAYMVPAADADWTVNGADQYSAVAGNVGIGTTTPANKLDVTGAITVSESLGDEMIINNDDVWNHATGLQDFGDGGDHFMVASKEGSGESAGIYGDGDQITIWSPGDGAPGQPAALLYVNDEDAYDGGTDSDPFNNSAMKAYLNTSGNWVAASDMKKKENIVEMTNVLEKLLRINGYTYNFKLSPVEIEKGDQKVTTYGVIAQEIIEEFPDIVDVAADGSLYVCYTELIPVLIEATQEQQEIINALQEENAALKARLESIEERLNAAGL